MHLLTMADAASSVSFFFEQVENGIASGAIFALVALGYTMVYGIIELINFAHGDVFMVGTVVSLTIVQALRLNSALGVLPLIGVLVLLFIAAMASCALLNVAIERVAYRPLRRAPRLAPLISAIGVSFILENIALFYKGSNPTQFPGIFSDNGINLGGVPITFSDIIVILVAIALMIGLTRFINTTKMGRAMRATAQDPEAAALMGVNVNQTISLTFLIGGALAGAAGVIYCLHVGAVSWNAGFQAGLIAFTCAVLGGIGNIRGAVVGGFLIGLIQSLTIAYVPDGPAYSDAVAFGILVIILVFRPSGLLGQQVPDKV